MLSHLFNADTVSGQVLSKFPFQSSKYACLLDRFLFSFNKVLSNDCNVYRACRSPNFKTRNSVCGTHHSQQLNRGHRQMVESQITWKCVYCSVKLIKWHTCWSLPSAKFIQTEAVLSTNLDRFYMMVSIFIIISGVTKAIATKNWTNKKINVIEKETVYRSVCYTIANGNGTRWQ